MKVRRPIRCMNSSPLFFSRFVLRGRVLLGVVIAALVLPFASVRGANDLARKTFASAEDAVRALSTAVNQGDTNSLAAIFGPDFNEIKSPDQVQWKSELAAFAASLNVSNHLERLADDRRILETGEDGWPFPIPIVRQDDVWFFDTEAGKQELINRRIGRNELQALKSIRAAADAQREYAAADRNGDGVLAFAQKIISTPGTKDGLYWPAELDGEMSPLGPAFADAQSQAYLKQPLKQNTPQPFHGYFFRILNRQGKHAPGGEYDYIINGHMIAGFAFVAWPADYGNTGIMTFIINQQGKVYQKDLGPNTGSIVRKMKAYDPGPGWTVSPD
jgi:Protein of unknown function (DUF2950)